MASEDARQRTTIPESTEARSELAEYLEVSERQHKLFPRAALVGFCSGAVAVAFRALIGIADSLRNVLIAWSQAFPAIGWLVPVLFSAIAATIAVAIVRWFAPEAAGSGIPI